MTLKLHERYIKLILDIVKPNFAYDIIHACKRCKRPVLNSDKTRKETHSFQCNWPLFLGRVFFAFFRSLYED